MNVLLIHTLVLALASHRIAAHERRDSNPGSAAHQGEMHLSGERGTASSCGRVSGSAGGGHPIAGIVGDVSRGQAGRLIGRSIKMPAPGNR